MLILTRKIGESVIIGDNIRVAILEVRGKQIRLGIEAPPDIVVLREEIQQRLANDNKQAANFSYPDLLELVRAVCSVKGAAPISPATTSNHLVPVDTRDLGPIKVRPEQIVTFPSGLSGFSKFRTFALIKVPQISPIQYLQCVEESSLAFPVADAALLCADFKVEAPANALKELLVEKPGDLQALALLIIPAGRPRETTANLVNPLLINPLIHQGKQVVMESSHLSARFRIVPL